MSSAYLIVKRVGCRAPEPLHGSEVLMTYAVGPMMMLAFIVNNELRQCLLKLREVLFHAKKKIPYPVVGYAKSGSGNWTSFLIRVLCRTVTNALEFLSTNVFIVMTPLLFQTYDGYNLHNYVLNGIKRLCAFTGSCGDLIFTLTVRCGAWCSLFVAVVLKFVYCFLSFVCLITWINCIIPFNK